MARLLYNDLGGRQQALELDSGRQQVVLGRQSDCDIIVHDTSVSRRHCVIVPGDDGFSVVDLGSANGTLVNDVRITRRRLVDGDVIRCGIYSVRFVDPPDAPQPVQMTLRDRYRRRAGDGGLRARAERLQALNESQSARLVQLQDELTRVDGQRVTALERAARSEADLLAAGQQIREMQARARQLAAALKYREGGAVFEPVPPPPPPPDGLDGPPAGLGSGATDVTEARLVARNRALRATIAQLEGALAAEDAYSRSATLAPAVDRWRAVAAERRALADARRRADEADARARAAQSEAAALRQALADARRSDPARGSSRDADAESKRLRGRVIELERQNAALRARPDAAGDDAPPGLAGGRRSGLLSGLGGLGRTASEGELGNRSLSARLSQLNRRSEEVDKLRARVGELQQAAAERDALHAQARRAAGVLVERLERQRDTSGLTGMAAVQLAELVDLATMIRDSLG